MIIMILMWNKNLQESSRRNVLSTRLQPLSLAQAGTAVGSWGHGKQISSCAQPCEQLGTCSFMENHCDYEVSMVQAGAKDIVCVLYNFWVLTISVRRLDAFLERECRSHWVEVMYLGIAPGWQCFQLDSLNLAENIANRAPCPGSNLTWVHTLRLSWNLVCTGTHYDYARFLFEDWTHFWKENAGPIE